MGYSNKPECIKFNGKVALIPFLSKKYPEYLGSVAIVLDHALQSEFAVSSKYLLNGLSRPVEDVNSLNLYKPNKTDLIVKMLETEDSVDVYIHNTLSEEKNSIHGIIPGKTVFQYYKNYNPKLIILSGIQMINRVLEEEFEEDDILIDLLQEQAISDKILIKR